MSDRVGVVLLHRGDPSTPDDAKGWLKTAYSDPIAYRLSFGSEAQKALAVPLAWWDGKALAQKIREVGGRAPTASAATALAGELESKLNGANQGTGAAKFRVLAGLRYTTPSIAEACAQLKQDGIKRIVGVSLYPQQCKRFFESSGKALSRDAEEGAEVSLIDRCAHPLYFEAVRDCVERALERAPEASVLFAALHLDRSDATDGDPYPEQLVAAVETVMAKLDKTTHRIAWLELGGPGLSVDEMLTKYREGGSTSVVLCPIGSSIDELELVHALDFRLRPLCKQLGFSHVERAASVSTSPKYVEALAATVTEHLARVGSLGFQS
jgi:ferrochelatase